jgi:hypothetical protein
VNLIGLGFHFKYLVDILQVYRQVQGRSDL